MGHRDRFTRNVPTPETLALYLNYNHETGDLTWSNHEGNPRKAGRPASRIGRVGGSGARHIKVLGRTFQAHEVVWALHTGQWPEFRVVARNGDLGDLRWANLDLKPAQCDWQTSPEARAILERQEREREENDPVYRERKRLRGEEIARKGYNPSDSGPDPKPTKGSKQPKPPRWVHPTFNYPGPTPPTPPTTEANQEVPFWV
jgi:hypothetical protein